MLSNLSIGECKQNVNFYNKYSLVVQMNDCFISNPTKAERRLAQALRRQKIKFIQNQILNGFEVDFSLVNYKILIEVDGYTHLSQQKRQADSYKDQRLNEAGYLIVHFTNQEIWEELAKCVKIIEEMLEANRIARYSTSINTLWKEELKKVKVEQPKAVSKVNKEGRINKPKNTKSLKDIEDYFLSLE